MPRNPDVPTTPDLAHAVTRTAGVGACLLSAAAACWWAVPTLDRVRTVWDAQFDPQAYDDHLDLAARAVGLGVGVVLAFVFALILVVAAVRIGTSLDDARGGLSLAALAHLPAVGAAVVGSARTSVLLPIAVAAAVLTVAVVVDRAASARGVSSSSGRPTRARIEP